MMRIQTENHDTAHITNPAETAPCVNEVRAPAQSAKLAIAAPELGRPRLLVRRETRWARRASR